MPAQSSVVKLSAWSSVVKLSACALALAAAVVPGAAASASNAAASCLKVTANIAIPESLEEFPSATVMNPATDTLYVADSDNAYEQTVIYVISGKTNTVETTIAVPAEIFGLWVNPQTDTLYATGWAAPNGVLITIDGQTNTISSTTSPGYEPLDMALDPKTQRMFVTNRLRNSTKFDLLILDGPDYDKVSKTVPTGRQGGDVAVDTTTDKVYIPSSSEINGLTVIDGRSGDVTGTVAAGPGGPIVDSTTDTIYLFEQSGITVFDAKTSTVTGTITPPGDGDMESMTIDSTANRLYLSQDKIGRRAQHGYVYLVNGQTNAVEATAEVGLDPQLLVTDPRTHDVYAIVGRNSAPSPTPVTVLHDSCSL